MKSEHVKLLCRLHKTVDQAGNSNNQNRWILWNSRKRVLFKTTALSCCTHFCGLTACTATDAGFRPAGLAISSFYAFLIYQKKEGIAALFLNHLKQSVDDHISFIQSGDTCQLDNKVNRSRTAILVNCNVNIAIEHARIDICAIVAHRRCC